jgi:hypothetical protein
MTDIIIGRAMVGGKLWWSAKWRHQTASRGFGETPAEAVRRLKAEFPDDGAQTLVEEE